MGYQLQYNICAIIIYFVVLNTHLFRKKTNELHNKVFTIMLVDGFLGVIINMFNTCGNLNMVDINIYVLYVLDYLYFITLNFAVACYVFYVIAIVNNTLLTKKKMLNALIIIPCLIEIAIICSNPWVKGVFYYSDGIYQRGSLQIVLYGIDLFFATYGVIYILIDKKMCSTHLKMSLCMFLVIGCITSLIQVLKPEILLQHFGVSICTLLILLSLQRPEEYIDSKLGVYNAKVFNRIFEMNIASNKKMELLIINIKDVEFLIQTMGIQFESKLMKEIAEFLDNISNGNVYSIDMKNFIILDEECKSGYLDGIITKIYERFQTEWGQDSNKMIIYYKIMKVSAPQDVRTLDLLYFSKTAFEDIATSDNNIVDVKDIDFDKAERRIKLENIIKRAIAEDNFEMYYQPIYSLKEDKIVSAEALIRLKDPDEGMISPGEFIPIAESNGLIIKIGEIVFDKVFDFINRNNLEKIGIEYIELNLSIIQCMQKELSQKILRLMNKYNVTSDMINLEITETAAAESPKMLVDNIEKLSSEGVTFSLDDFGTGYSNISSLMSLPLDIIKFDKSMVDMITTHEQGKNIIDSSVAMVKKMGMHIVAEGIEQKEQIDIMRDMGVDYLQGYYFSKPLPENQFLEYVAKRAS